MYMDSMFSLSLSLSPSLSFYLLFIPGEFFFQRYESENLLPRNYYKRGSFFSLRQIVYFNVGEVIFVISVFVDKIHTLSITKLSSPIKYRMCQIFW